jgi:hypothetical protein
MAQGRSLPVLGSPEARNQGCTCPPPRPGQGGRDNPPAFDRNCPVHGIAAVARHRLAERGQVVDTEGDIVDAATEEELLPSVER